MIAVKDCGKVWNLEEIVRDYQNGNPIEAAVNFIEATIGTRKGVELYYRRKSGSHIQDIEINSEAIKGALEYLDSLSLEDSFDEDQLKKHIGNAISNGTKRLHGNPYQYEKHRKRISSHNLYTFNREFTPKDLIDSKALIPGELLEEFKNEEYDEIKQKISQLIDTLTKFEGKIFYYRYGYGLSIEETKKRLKIGREKLNLILSRFEPQLSQKAIDLEIKYNPDNLSYVIRELFEEDPENILHMIPLLPKTSKLRDNYMIYKRKKERVSERFRGVRFVNPIIEISDASIPLIRGVLYEIENSKTNCPEEDLKKRGFREIIRLRKNKRNVSNFGMLAKMVTPEILHKFKGIEKWNKGETSKQIALRTIEDVFYNIGRYKEAEESNDEESIVTIMNKFLQSNNKLKDFLRINNCAGLMESFIDPKGLNGIKLKGSPRAVFDFYYENKYPQLLDRNNTHYLQLWRINERNRWQKGEKSIQTALEISQDFLRDIPGFRIAEDNKNRKNQLIILDRELFSKNEYLSRYLIHENRLGRIMKKEFRDPLGINGFKGNSPEAFFSFYDMHMKH